MENFEEEKMEENDRIEKVSYFKLVTLVTSAEIVIIQGKQCNEMCRYALIRDSLQSYGSRYA